MKYFVYYDFFVFQLSLTLFDQNKKSLKNTFAGERNIPKKKRLTNKKLKYEAAMNDSKISVS